MVYMYQIVRKIKLSDNSTHKEIIQMHTNVFSVFIIEQSAFAYFIFIFFEDFNWIEYSAHYYFYGEEKRTWTDAKVLYLYCYYF